MGFQLVGWRWLWQCAARQVQTFALTPKSGAGGAHSRTLARLRGILENPAGLGVRALCAAFLLALGLAGWAAEPAAADMEEENSPWDWSATVRGGAGYKDNIFLSDFFKESSP